LIKSELSPAVLQAIAEAVTWCTDKPFRSPELDPSAILDIPDYSHGLESIEAWIEKKRDCYRRPTSWINQTRSELLKAASIEPLDAVDALSRSKLLIYEALETVDNGASEAGFMSFYDVHMRHLGIRGFCMRIIRCSVVFPSLPFLVHKTVLMRIQLIASTGPIGLSWLISRNNRPFAY
jgi:hypothetical protein